MMENRRHFIKQLSTVGLMGCMPNILHALAKPAPDKIWGSLLHLSFNMWEEYIAPEREMRGYRPYLQLSEKLWSDARESMVKSGLNMVLIDLGDAVKYKSHPEIGIENAWSRKRLREELAKFRAVGIEPIPKLNFAAGHDAWLGEYSKMVSTKTYYEVCRDLIAEVADLFDKPRFFHIGMDEEDATHQKLYQHVVIRQGDLWWKDFYYLVNQVEKQGCRPWIWSDYIWHYPEVFLAKMPKSVVQSNWYYRNEFADKTLPRLRAYAEMEEKGYDQIPTGTSLYPDRQENMLLNVKYCKENIADNRLLGFLQTLWVPTIETYREGVIRGIELTGEAKTWFAANQK